MTLGKTHGIRIFCQKCGSGILIYETDCEDTLSGIPERLELNASIVTPIIARSHSRSHTVRRVSLPDIQVGSVGALWGKQAERLKSEKGRDQTISRAKSDLPSCGSSVVNGIYKSIAGRVNMETFVLGSPVSAPFSSRIEKYVL